MPLNRREFLRKAAIMGAAAYTAPLWVPRPRARTIVPDVPPGMVPYTASRAITEHGLYAVHTEGTLFDRSVFSAVNIETGQSMVWDYTFTAV